MNDYVFLVVTPCYNAAKNLQNIADSLTEQTYKNWLWAISDDESTDDTEKKSIEIVNNINGRAAYFPSNGDKKYALKNIVDRLGGIDSFVKDCYGGKEIPNDRLVVAIIDGDDQLCNPRALEIIVKEYEDGCDVVWTAHKWDVNESMNVSGPLPDKVNPYLYQWCASHFRTFRKDVFDRVNQDNFKNIYGEWFKRGYDQALMLPILYLSDKRKYVDEVCYQYNINSVSMDRSMDTTSGQLNTVKFVRARGYIR